VTFKIERENLAHNLCLGPLDFKLARSAKHRTISVAPAASVPAITHHASQASARLLSEVLEKKGADKSLNADMNFADRVIDECSDLDLREIEPLVDAGHIFLIAGNAIERLRDDDGKLAGLSITRRFVGKALVLKRYFACSLMA
jgi:hypothetical protein